MWARLQSDEPGWPVDPVDRAFERELAAWLQFHAAMLVDELVRETLTYLRDNPAVPEMHAFRHVLVDEYQDLNKAEQTLLDLLAQGSDMTVIGDEDQSIYSFKHAYPDGIRTFPDRHVGTCNETLEECRRCPTRIVTMANHLIDQNLERTPRVLHTLPSNAEGEVYVVQWETMNGAAEGIARFIAERVRSGSVDPGRVLVLAPRRLIGYGIRDALLADGVTAYSFFQKELLEGNPHDADACDAQRAFSLLRLLALPDDRVALRCWCGFGSASLQSGEWRRLRDYCLDVDASPFDVLTDIATGKLSVPGMHRLEERYSNLRKHLTALQDLPGPELVDALFPAGQEWANGIRSAAQAFPADVYTPPELCDWMLAAITRQEAPIKADYVRVMSLHKAKGLTADLVIVAGCVEGTIPREDNNVTPAVQQQKLEEQRRLFYVAITRARNTLVLSSFTQLRRHEAHKMMPHVRSNTAGAQAITSRFVRELGPARPAAMTGDAFLRDSCSAAPS